MSLRERLLIASSLVLGLSAVGCGDGDDVGTIGGDEDGGDTPMMDASKPDDAGTDSAKPDSGNDAGTTKFPTKTCGANTCEGNLINNMLVDPCCVPDGTGAPTSTCGFEADDIKKANPTSPFTGCVPRDVPAASASVYCGEFWDQVEMAGDHENGGLDIQSGRVTFVFDGCCLPTGECGAQIDIARMQNESLNSHLGCVSYGRLNEALNGADAGMSAPPAKLPFCNPATGAPPVGTATIVGQPKFVCGCGEGKVDDGTGTFPCFNNLPTTVCGAADPTAAQLAMVPEFICGCPADISKARLPCLINVAESVCGTKAIDATSAELAKVPVFVCGEDPAKPSVLPTLKGVEPTVCGSKAVEPGSSDLAAVPAFICGATNNPDTTLPKLPNLPQTTCGGLAVGAGSPYLAQIPEFICGAVGLTSTPSLPVLRNVDKAVCGAKQIDANSAELTLVPEFICGVDAANPTPLPTLQGVDPAVCGKKQIDTNSAELALVPEFICGATGATAQTAGLPHLRNVEAAVCGKKEITTDSAELNDVPTFICGADGGTFIGLPQLLGVANSVCGKKVMTQDSAELTNVPEFLCGAVGSTDASPLPKLAGVAANICGKEVVDANSPRLAGVPKFICGCDSNPALELGCMRNVESAVCGGATPSVALLTQVPEFICGCGLTTRDPVVGSVCMSFVDSATCGTKVTQVGTRASLGNIPCLVDVPEYAMGCGPNAGPTATNPCLRNAGPSPNIPGCVDATPSVPASVYGLRRLPEYFCGCGATNAYTGASDTDGPMPCLSFVDKPICGTIAIPVAQAIQQRLPTLPASFCGCGDGQANTNASSLPCIPNVPMNFCAPAAIPTNPTGGAGATPCALGYPLGGIPGCVGLANNASDPFAPAYPVQCIPNTSAPSCPP
jgi:hypothetical protein